MHVQMVFLLLLVPFGLCSPNGTIAIYLAGDSTMAEKLEERRPETGWGERLGTFFSPRHVRVENHARNGRSTRSFIAEGRWQGILDRLEKGDYVFIQFGHNDANEARVDRYTPPDDYRLNLIRFVTEARAKEARPVLFTPVVRRRFDLQGHFYDTHGVYPDIVRQVAAEYDVPLVDMHRSSERQLREYGSEKSKALFLHLAPGESGNYPNGMSDDTHFSPAGAALMAGLAVEGIQELGLDLADRVSRPATSLEN
jgi:lysophospholipase L1-like esterase